jgi:serine/threonine-protein phosphatase PGAM5
MNSFRHLLIGILALVCFSSASLAQDKPAPAAFTRTIYLVRHGAYDTEQKGDEDVAKGLTPLGLAQARLVAARLRGLPVTFSSFTVSPMLRARQTAAVIGQMFPQLTPQISPLLREVTPRTWRTDIMKTTTPEAAAAAEAQLDQAFATFFIPAADHDSTDLLVCHGNVIRYLVTKALGVDTQSWLGMAVAHCSLTIIQVTPKGTFKVLAVGDAGHIPPNLQSGLSGAPDPQLVAP